MSPELCLQRRNCAVPRLCRCPVAMTLDEPLLVVVVGHPIIEPRRHPSRAYTCRRLSGRRLRHRPPGTGGSAMAIRLDSEARMTTISSAGRGHSNRAVDRLPGVHELAVRYYLHQQDIGATDGRGRKAHRPSLTPQAPSRPPRSACRCISTFSWVLLAKFCQESLPMGGLLFRGAYGVSREILGRRRTSDSRH